MDEAAISKVNAHVGERLVQRVVKDKVAREQLIGGDRIACLALAVGVSRKRNAVPRTKYMCDKTAAIESGRMRCPSVFVIDPDRSEHPEEHFGLLGRGPLNGRRLSVDGRCFGCSRHVRRVFNRCGTGGGSAATCEREEKHEYIQMFRAHF